MLKVIKVITILSLMLISVGCMEDVYTPDDAGTIGMEEEVTIEKEEISGFNRGMILEEDKNIYLEPFLGFIVDFDKLYPNITVDSIVLSAVLLLENRDGESSSDVEVIVNRHNPHGLSSNKGKLVLEEEGIYFIALDVVRLDMVITISLGEYEKIKKVIAFIPSNTSLGYFSTFIDTVDVNKDHSVIAVDWDAKYLFQEIIKTELEKEDIFVDYEVTTEQPINIVGIL